MGVEGGVLVSEDAGSQIDQIKKRSLFISTGWLRQFNGFYFSLGAIPSHSFVWFFEKKVDSTEQKHISARGGMHKDSLLKFFGTKSTMSRKLSTFNRQGVANSICRSLGSDFWPRN